MMVATLTRCVFPFNATPTLSMLHPSSWSLVGPHWLVCAEQLQVVLLYQKSHFVGEMLKRHQITKDLTFFEILCP